MKSLKMYEPDDKMISLIRDNYDLLQSLGSFGISLGFGDKTVKETCDDNGVDTYTFLAVVNFTINGCGEFENDDKLSVPTLLHYLEACHAYFLDFQLPYIRRELQESLNEHDSLGNLILRFYDEYAHEIRRHMRYEQKTLFPYVQSLLDGHPASDYNVETFSKHHGAADKKLRELKLLIIKYLPQDGLHNNQLTATLHDIYENEVWLRQHAMVEDYIFVPAIRRLELVTRQSDVTRNISRHGVQRRHPKLGTALRPRARRRHRRGAGPAKQGDCRPPVHLGEHRHHPSPQHCPQAPDSQSRRPHHLRHRQQPRRYISRQAMILQQLEQLVEAVNLQ